MADIFLSYAKEDRDHARSVATLLERQGWKVWWDRRIPAGRTWRDVLEEALLNMRCMVVLWSSHSIESDWVKEEAEEARAVKKLVPVLIEPVNPPVGFRTIQAADLTDWDGKSESLGARQLIADLEALLGKPERQAAVKHAPSPIPEAQSADRAPDTKLVAMNAAARGVPLPRESGREELLWLRRFWKPIAGGGVLLALILGIFAPWTEWRATKQDTVATVTSPVPETPAPPQTPVVPQLVKLGVHGERGELEPADTLSLALRGWFSDGSEERIKSGIEWKSSNPKVATVDDEGRVTARRAGTTKITAGYHGLSSPPWTLAVKAVEVIPPPAPKLVAMSVDARKNNLVPDEKISLGVTGRYSDGSKKDLAGEVVWVSSNSSVASVNSRGELQALRAGTAEVVARSGDVTSGSLRVSVKQPPVAPAPQKVPEAKPLAPAPQKPPEVQPVAPQLTAAQLRAKIASYVNRAKDFRVQGDYASALAELASAQATDPASSEVRAEIEQTKRACLAEKKLGRKSLDC